MHALRISVRSAESEKEKTQVKTGRAILHAELKRAFSQAPADFRKLLSVRNSNRREKGLHSLDEGGKLGESTDMDDRTARQKQKYITMEVIITKGVRVEKGGRRFDGARSAYAQRMC